MTISRVLHAASLHPLRVLYRVLDLPCWGLSYWTKDCPHHCVGFWLPDDPAAETAEAAQRDKSSQLILLGRIARPGPRGAEY